MLRKTLSKFISLLYEKIFIVNDTPQKIALGFGLGVFTGILPGAGPLAALFLALLFRANRATALFGSILTNTWISFLTLILAIKVGAAIFGVKWQSLQQSWHIFLKGFSWPALFKLSVLKITLPVIAGYLAVSFFFGLLAYLVTLLVILEMRKGKNRLGLPK